MEIIMFMLNFTVCLVYTGYAFAIQSHANIQVEQRCWIVFIRATFSKRNKYSHFPLKIKSQKYRGEPGCLGGPTFSQRETLSTCRSSSPYRSTAREGKVVGNMLNRNKEQKLWLRGHKSLPMEAFIRHSQGYNRGLLTMSLGLWNGSVYLNPRRTDRNSQQQYNMTQPSAGHSAARVRLCYFGLGTSVLILEPYQLGLSVIKGSKLLHSENRHYSTSYTKMASKTSAENFADLLMQYDFQHNCFGFQENMLTRCFPYLVIKQSPRLTFQADILEVAIVALTV